MAAYIFDAILTGDRPTTYDFSQMPSPPYDDPLSVGDAISCGPQSGAVSPNFLILPSFLVGIDKQRFLYDFYYRVWTLPLRMELRNPRVGVDIPFVIWNAYPWDNTLQGISGTGLDGLTLDVAAPSVFKEIEYRTINLQILPSAPLSIEANFVFDFEYDGTTFTFIADRASVLSIVPDVPIAETWSWLTDVVVSTNGTEQRIGLRAVPRRSMTAKLIALNEQEIAERWKQFLFDLAGQVVIPYYQYGTPSTENAVVGAGFVAFDPATTDLRDGEYIFILTKDGQELARVETLQVNGATLDAPLTIDVPQGSIISPAFASVVENRSSIKRYAVHEVAEIEVSSMVSQARAAFARPGSTAVIAQHDGYNILDKLPLANSLVEDKFDAGYERFDYAVGTIEQISRWEFTRDEGGRQYSIKRVQHPEEMDYWRDFLDDARGKLNPFLVPTFRRDLFVSVAPNDAGNTFDISGSDYGSLYWPKVPYKRLYLWTAGGAVPVTVSAVVLLENGDTQVTLANPLPAGIQYTDISHISFLLKMRLASDEVTLEHYGLESIINIAVRTVPE